MKFLICLSLWLAACSFPAPKESPAFTYDAVRTPSLQALAEPMLFNGHSDFISLGQKQNILSNVRQATLAAWIKPTTLAGTQDIIAVSIGGANSGYTSRASLRLAEEGKLHAFGRTEDANNPAPEVRSREAKVRKNIWQYLAALFYFDQNKIELYLNGKKLKTTALTSNFSQPTTPQTLSETITVGSEDNGSGFYFNGQLAQAEIWGHALSEQELLQLVRQQPKSGGLP